MSKGNDKNLGSYLELIMYIIATATLMATYIYTFLAFYSIATLGYFHTSESNSTIALGELLLILFVAPFVAWFFTETVRFIFDYALDMTMSEEGEEDG